MKIKTNLKAGASDQSIVCGGIYEGGYSDGYSDGNDDGYWEGKKSC